MIWQNFNFHFAAINCQLVSQRHINCYLSDYAGSGSQFIPASEVLVHLPDSNTVILYSPQHNHSLLSNDIRNNIASLHGRFTNIIIIYHFLPRIFSKAILTFYRKYFHVIFVSYIFESLDKSFSFQLNIFIAGKFYTQSNQNPSDGKLVPIYYPPVLSASKYATD